jgi:hypothetical protein
MSTKDPDDKDGTLDELEDLLDIDETLEPDDDDELTDDELTDDDAPDDLVTINKADLRKLKLRAERNRRTRKKTEPAADDKPAELTEESVAARVAAAEMSGDVRTAIASATGADAKTTRLIANLVDTKGITPDDDDYLELIEEAVDELKEKLPQLFEKPRSATAGSTQSDDDDDDDAPAPKKKTRRTKQPSTKRTSGDASTDEPDMYSEMMKQLDG